MNKLTKSTSIYTIGNILPKLASFLLLPLYTRFLTPSDYGIVSSMTLLQGILIIFTSLALERSIYRLYNDYNDLDRKQFLGTITIGIFSISFLTTILYIFVFDNVLNNIFKSIPFNPLYIYTILTVFFTTFSLVPKIYYMVEEKPNKFISISLSYFFIDTFLRILFITIFKWGASGQLLAMMTTSILYIPLFLRIMVKNFYFKFNKEMFINACKFSIPMIPSVICAWIINLSDRIFIERFFNMTDVGIYSFGYKIGEVVLIITSSFMSAYNPIYYKEAAKNTGDSKKQLSKYNTIYMVLVSIGAFLIGFFSKEIVFLFADKKYVEAYKIIPIITYSYMLSSFNGLSLMSMYQEKKTNKTMQLNIISAIMNIILNVIFIKSYGAIGAALATLITFIIQFAIGHAWSKKYYYIKVQWSILISINIIAVILIVINNIINNTIIYIVFKAVVISIIILSIILNWDKISCLIKMNRGKKGEKSINKNN